MCCRTFKFDLLYSLNEFYFWHFVVADHLIIIERNSHGSFAQEMSPYERSSIMILIFIHGICHTMPSSFCTSLEFVLSFAICVYACLPFSPIDQFSLDQWISAHSNKLRHTIHFPLCFECGVQFSRSLLLPF